MSEALINQNNLGRLEALLFISTVPLPISQIAEVMKISNAETDALIKQLAQNYSDGRGLAIQWHGGRCQLTTNPVFANDVENFLGLELSSKLTKPAIETLAIIAYRQPITRPGIEAIRGVSSDGVIKSLLSKGLIQEVGRTEGPGRPILFSTTGEFLQHFGLNSIEQLPPFERPEEENEQAKSTLLKD
jgi:segregation and condensation protein B